MKRSTPVRFSALLLTAMCLVSALAGAQEATPSCAATAPVMLSSSALPSTYDELAAYPATARAQVVGALPEATQSRLWRTHLQRFAAQRPDLTAAERALVDEAIALATPDLFAARLDTAQRPAHLERVLAFQDRALEVFGRQAFASGFVEFGELTSAVVRTAAVRARADNDIDSSGLCDCTPGYERWNCGRGQTCIPGGCSSPPNIGCGVFHFVRCTGTCWPGEGDEVDEKPVDT